MAKNILITGAPGTGKTTLIKRLAEAGALNEAVGFYTEEIRDKGTRVGFRLISLDGKQEAILAHRDIPSSYRAGRYGVDIGAFEDFLLRIEPSLKRAPLVVIDEIGKMECFSQRFVALLRELLSGPQSLIATVAMKGGGFIAEVKSLRDITLFTLTVDNREELFERILNLTSVQNKQDSQSV